MATCSCGQPLAADDVFCTGCGRRLGAVVSPTACPACGRPVSEPAAFCSGCGTALVASAGRVGLPPPPLPTAWADQPRGFQWKWALLTIPIVVAVTFAVMLATGILMVIMGVHADDTATQTTAGVVMLLVSMLLGGMLAGWASTGRTIVEPGVGIAAALTGVNLLTGETGGLLLGWILPFLIGAAGAWIGESLPRRSGRRTP